MTCTHPTPQWSLTGCNEDGWACPDCKAQLGFRPDFDREHTREKVDVVLLFLHEGEFLYVSNATMGDGIAAHITKVCHEKERFDQLSIIGFIVAALDHSEWYALEAKQFFCSHPSRTLQPGKPDMRICDACGHELEVKGSDDLPLFAKAKSEEPF